MKRTLSISVIIVFLAVSLRAADVSGVWSLRLTTTDDESAPRARVTLKQEGDKLSGSCVIDNTDEAFIVTGQVVDGTVTWRCTSRGPIAVSFKGTLNETGREMTGSWTTGAAGGSFKGSKPAK